jgi:hypothetical protein
VNNGFQARIRRLAEQNKFKEIVALIEEIPESGRDREIVGAYIRALNNTRQLERAAEVSLQYRDRDGQWHYRLGCACVNLNRNEEAETVPLRGKKLAGGDAQVTEWIGAKTAADTRRHAAVHNSGGGTNKKTSAYANALDIARLTEIKKAPARVSLASLPFRSCLIRKSGRNLRPDRDIEPDRALADALPSAGHGRPNAGAARDG